jgi:DNA mismatch repair protein MutL
MPRRVNNEGRPWIRPLPERLINKIAAGEVVERPSSVVKELVENSLDAGAKRIDVHVEKAGIKLIKVVDDGCGVGDEQIQIAFSRHATSKIAEFADLDAITSYGFRGEALPSIASVSRLRMVSRPADADAGTEIIFEGGVLQSKSPVSSPPGTQVEVENLFFNTPARRKFLKSEATELRHLSRTVMALAIGRYDVAFSYVVGERQIFAEPADQDLRTRVTSLLAAGKTVVEVRGESGRVVVQGYIGTPDQVQSNRRGQYIFINGRLIQSPTLSHAFIAGYGELIPAGSFPIGALLLTVDPGEVDVNVHPAKTEVRLSHEREIHDAVYRLIKESLHQDHIIPSFRSSGIRDRAGAEPSQSGEPAARHAHGKIPGLGGLAATNQEFMREIYRQPNPAAAGPDIVRVDTRTGEILDSETEPTASVPSVQSEPLRLIGRFSDLYLIFQRGDALLLVDQHTAHERVLFERTLKEIENSGVTAQQLLMPVQIELSPEQLALFDEAREVFDRSGFSVEPFGGRALKIDAVPAVLSRKSPEQAVRKILDDIESLKKAGYDLQKAMAQSIACRSAVMAGDRLNDREAVGLVEALLQCENMYSCPHGRPTFVKLTRSDLDRQFGR